jgi:hypothetical protein
MRVFVVALVIASAAAPSARQLPSNAAPDQTPGTGVIVGQVLDPGTGRGVPGAVVSISSPQSAGPPLLWTVNPTGPPVQPQALTMSDGRFLFRDLRQGTYTISASKPGYLLGSYGARRPGGGSAPLELDEGEHVTDVIVPVWRWGAISGTVVDEAGEPLVGIEVRAFRRTVGSGSSQFLMSGSAMTDDRGVYRISNLTPGDYVAVVPAAITSVPISVAEMFRDAMQNNDPNRTELSRTMFESGVTPPVAGQPNALQVGSSLQTMRGATPPPPADESRLFVYPTTFHPAARSLREATPLAIRSGDDRTGIDIDLKPVRATRISGTVVGPDGPAAHIGVRLEAATDEISIEPEAATISDASGAFTFPNVPSGQYTLRASRIPRPSPVGGSVTIIQSGNMMITTAGNPGPTPPPAPSTEPTLWAAMPLAVGQTPVTGVTVPLQNGSRIKGRVEFDGTAERPDASQLQRLMVVVEPMVSQPIRAQSIPPARVDANGEFTTGGVPGGRHFVRAPTTPAGWHFKETRYDGRDLSNTPIDLDGRDLTGVTIVFTDRPTEISGSVRIGQGSGDADATVLIFPADPETWPAPNPRRMRSIRTSKTGAYKAVALPPGDYYLAAVPDEAAVDWQDPRVLASLARDAARVTLDDGDRKTQDLRTQRR